MKQLIWIPALALSACAHAQFIVWDQGPGTGVIYRANNEDYEGATNELDSVTFAQTTPVNVYYHYGAAVTSGLEMDVRVFSDVGGHPGTLLQSERTLGSDVHLIGTDSFGENVYVHTLAFGGGATIVFQGGVNYWVGAASVSQTQSDTGTLIQAPQDGSCAVMNQDMFQGFAHGPTGGDLMFRLGSPVPEPKSFASLGVGVLLLCRGRRKQNAR